MVYAKKTSGLYSLPLYALLCSPLPCSTNTRSFGRFVAVAPCSTVPALLGQ